MGQLNGVVGPHGPEEVVDRDGGVAPGKVGGVHGEAVDLLHLGDARGAGIGRLAHGLAFLVVHVPPNGRPNLIRQGNRGRYRYVVRHRCVGAAFAMMQLKAIFSVLLQGWVLVAAQPLDSYRNDHSKMVVQLEQRCPVRSRRRTCAETAS